MEFIVPLASAVLDASPKPVEVLHMWIENELVNNIILLRAQKIIR